MMLPPGKYYVGDPCYVFDHLTWDRLLKQVHDEHGGFDRARVVTFDGQQLWAHSTKGDGEFSGSDGVEYGVDSSLLGAVPMDLVENPAGLDDGSIVEAPNGLYVKYDAGRFTFGDVVISTSNPGEGEFDGDHDHPDILWI